ncbi:hypothetical protein E2C01_082259 [Portunus trituberculatus]|uniref:Uncharacterized protein n=1 Tax=Portunus trituberculatus TaxID=210409 RepID=A0A5B7J3B0_PORTR|nr:hypothetical protein [Portunus trituberculatus]
MIYCVAAFVHGGVTKASVDPLPFQPFSSLPIFASLASLPSLLSLSSLISLASLHSLPSLPSLVSEPSLVSLCVSFRRGVGLRCSADVLDAPLHPAEEGKE